MTPDQLAQTYMKGAITAHHFLVESVNRIGLFPLDEVMDAIPPRLHEELKAYLSDARSGPMRSNYGLDPTPEQREQAWAWLEAHSPVRLGSV